MNKFLMAAVRAGPDDCSYCEPHGGVASNVVVTVHRGAGHARGEFGARGPRAAASRRACKREIGIVADDELVDEICRVLGPTLGALVSLSLVVEVVHQVDVPGACLRPIPRAARESRCSFR